MMISAVIRETTSFFLRFRIPKEKTGVLKVLLRSTITYTDKLRCAERT